MLAVDYEEIRDARDRSKTFDLLERLRRGDPSEQQKVVVTLCTLDDPRSVPELQSVLHDPRAAAGVRTACGLILRELRNVETPSDHMLRQWWTSGDEVLQRHALLQMSHAQRDIVDSALDDVNHPLHGAAVETLASGFSSPATVERLIAALRDARPEIRRAAARTLVWDEPLTACQPLIDASHDEHASVAINALDTLCYYPTLETIRVAD